MRLKLLKQGSTIRTARGHRERDWGQLMEPSLADRASAASSRKLINSAFLSFANLFIQAQADTKVPASLSPVLPKPGILT